MALSADGILQVTFDPEWATCSLVVDGGLWPSPVASLTIVRSVPGLPDVPVRGAVGRAVVEGYFIGSDSEMPLDSTVRFSVTGLSATGETVSTSSVTVETSGAACGAWLKVAGRPDLTVRAELVSAGDVTSATQGGVYDVAGGGRVAASVASVSGVAAERLSLEVRGATDTQARAVSRTLENRILLIQSCVHRPFDPGWYFVSGTRRSRRAPLTSLPGHDFTLDLVATGVPSGAGQGIVGWSWAGVGSTYPSWDSLTAGHPSWWSLLQGAS